MRAAMERVPASEADTPPTWAFHGEPKATLRTGESTGQRWQPFIACGWASSRRACEALQYV